MQQTVPRALAILAVLAAAACGAEPTTRRTQDAEVADAWVKVIDAFKAGDDGSARRIASAAARRREQPGMARDRLLFFAATSERSYFGASSIASARAAFGAIADDGVDSPFRRAAELVTAIESGRDTTANFDALAALAMECDEEPLHWITGIQARVLRRHEPGVKAYARLLEKVGGNGPAIVHQTYANLLDSLKRYDDALEQRELSIATEPAGWNYDGKGNTLSAMGRYVEADAAYAEAMQLVPDRGNYVTNRARNAIRAKRFEAAREFATLAVKLSPADHDPWYLKGRAHYALNEMPDAAAAFQRSLDIFAPANAWAARYLADALAAQRKDAEAEAVREKYRVALERP